MICSNHFVYIHLPKTGGNFLRDVLARYAPDSWGIRTIDDHPSIRMVPDEYNHLPKFGFVRNPYDWYVSWHHHQKQVLKTPFFLEISDNGKRNFRETLLAIDAMNFSEFFNMDYSRFNREIGGYTAYLFYMYGFEFTSVRLGKFERLRKDILSILKNIVPVPFKLEVAIRRHPLINPSKHEHYRRYYDEDLRRLIATRDRIVFERFDYQ